MDYKEKYNKLVEAIKVLQETNPSDVGIQNWVNDNVPELRESEDEKIRKELISFLQSYNTLLTQKFITWLEEQEQKPYGQRKECLDCQFNYAGECKGSCQMKRDEQKPSDMVEPLDELAGLTDFERTLADICIGWIGEEPGWKQYIKDNADALLKIAIEKFNSVQDASFKQKSTWSEEDEEHLNSIISDIKTDMGAYPRSQEVIHIYNDDISFLKSLKERYTWKPSDEQMKALDSAIDEFDGYQEFGSLVSLKKDLEKLKGE